MQWLQEKRFEVGMLTLLLIGVLIGGWFILNSQAVKVRHGAMIRAEDLPDTVSLKAKPGGEDALDFLAVDEIKYPDVFVERQTACLYDRDHRKTRLTLRKRQGKPICNPAYVPSV